MRFQKLLTISMLPTCLCMLLCVAGCGSDNKAAIKPEQYAPRPPADNSAEADKKPVAETDK